MKSIRGIFRNSKKKKEKSSSSSSSSADASSPQKDSSTKHSPPSPSPSSELSHIASPNGTNTAASLTSLSLGHHSNASTISRVGIAPESESVPPVPVIPSTINGTSIHDLSSLPQSPPTPHHYLASAPSLQSLSGVPSSTTPSTPTTPNNPQLHSDSLLISSHNPLPPLPSAPEPDDDSRPTVHDPRSPHAVQEQDEQGLSDEMLQRASTLPPSYNSLNIPPPAHGNMHIASAPSPAIIHASAGEEALAHEATSPGAPGASTMPYVSPPPVSSPYHQSYPSSASSPNWSQTYSGASSSYAPPSPSVYSSTPTTPYSPSIGSSQYGHRPYVMPGNENQTYPIIMAIDWGTTYSSMAYAYQQDGEVHEVSTWPKQTHNYPKVPTCNLYGPNSKEILEWGYTAKVAITKPPYKNHVLLSKYKLHLDEASGPHPPLPNGLTIVDAIADYLRLFHAHVVQTVLKGFGAAFEQQHIQYCLSVPAMWTDNAKALMRQAALQAGMISPLDPPHRLLLISEPEAAALYCEKKCDQFSIGHGQRFMICDAGGGTVDLIVFEVAVGPQGRTLREVTRGSGHSCGSIFLDERMEALLRGRFSKWQEKGLTAANWVQLMDTFIHNVKPLFDGVEDQYITMPAIPGRADLTDYDIGLEDGVLTVTAEEMRREVFDPVVNDVLRLIQHQLQQTNYQCHAIFLVGGFGSSGYLQKRVQDEFGTRVPMIGVPPRAELAVVRGAAYAGLMPKTVTQRVARRWYGVDSLMAFEEGQDLVHKKVRDREGAIRARDRFSVYISPGQQIGVDECITKRYITYQYPKPVNSPLFACSSSNLPRYVDSPMVEKIGDFLIPLPFVPGALPGHKMVFELRMYFGATEIRAEAEINGMVVSTRCQFAG
ncbi:hypothetical protein BGZ82_003913 [Podila clonocystis]|nr:hypothetical protein BGZ82_003913 [Podila clonocystis]